jgi:hypothetical protein
MSANNGNGHLTIGYTEADPPDSPLVNETLIHVTQVPERCPNAPTVNTVWYWAQKGALETVMLRLPGIGPKRRLSRASLAFSSSARNSSMRADASFFSIYFFRTALGGILRCLVYNEARSIISSGGVRSPVNVSSAVSCSP